MLALKEFANFVTLNMANLATTYARLLASSSVDYAAFPANNRISLGRKLLKAVSAACEQQTSTHVTHLFKESSNRWPPHITPQWPVIEIECLGQTLIPVVPNLEASRFLWQILFEVRSAILQDKSTVSIPVAASVPFPVKTKQEAVPLAQDTAYQKIQEELLKFKMGIDRSADAIFLTNIDGEIVFVNPSFEKVYGYSREEALGQTPRILKSGLIPQKSYTDFWQTLLSGEIVAGEIINQTKDARLKNIDASNNPILDEAGKIIGFLSIHRDVTQRKKAEETLQANEERFRQIIDSIAHHIYVSEVLDDGPPLNHYLSPNIETLTGYPHQKFVEDWQFWPSQVIYPKDRELAAGQLKQLTQGKDSAVEYRMTRANGDVIWVRDSARVHIQGTNRMIYGIVSNITERKQLQLDAENLYQAAADFNMAQSYTDIVAVLRRYTLLRQGPQTVNLGYFDKAWTFDYMPKEVEILTRWSQISTESFSSRYLLSQFPAAKQLLHPTEPVLVEDISSDPRMDETTRSIYLDRFKAKSTLFAPLIVGGQRVGYVNATYARQITFSEPDVRRLMTLTRQAAVAVQNLRNIDLAKQRTRQLEQLTQVELKLSQATTEVEILETIAQVVDFGQLNRLVLQYLETDRNDRPTTLETVAVWEDGAIKHEDPDLDKRNTIGHFSVSKLWVNAPNDVLFVSNVETDPRLEPDVRSFLLQLQVAAFATLPLRSSNRWQGVISFNWATPHNFSAKEQFVLSSLLESIAAIVASRRAYLAQEDSLAEMEVLYQASTDLNHAQSFDDILKALRKHTILGLNTQNISLNRFDRPWTVDQKPEWINTVARWTQLSPPSVSHRYPVSDFSSISKLLSGYSPTVIHDVVNDPLLDENTRALFVDGFGAKSTIFVPLVAGGQWIGFINGIYQQPTIFPEPTIRRLMALAGLSAVVMQAVQQLAETEYRVRRERTIREITEKMRGAVNLEELVSVATQELGRQLSATHVELNLGIEPETRSTPAANPGSRPDSNGY